MGGEPKLTRGDLLVKALGLASLSPLLDIENTGLRLLDFTWKPYGPLRRWPSLIWRTLRTMAIMTLDEKIRFGMLALSGASLVFASLGLHMNPLEIIGGSAVG